MFMIVIYLWSRRLYSIVVHYPKIHIKGIHDRKNIIIPPLVYFLIVPSSLNKGPGYKKNGGQGFVLWFALELRKSDRTEVMIKATVKKILSSIYNTPKFMI